MAKVVWIAGPIQYWEGNYKSFDMAWDFVGEDEAQHIRRWRLMYSTSTRSFAAKTLNTDQGDQAHASAIRNLYRAVAVLRRDLPLGGTADTLRAMLPKQEIVFATRLTLGGRNR